MPKSTIIHKVCDHNVVGHRWKKFVDPRVLAAWIALTKKKAISQSDEDLLLTMGISLKHTGKEVTKI